MSRCTKWHGIHDWSAWTDMYGAPKKYPGGAIGMQKYQTRKCHWCGYTEIEWLPSMVPVEDEEAD